MMELSSSSLCIHWFLVLSVFLVVCLGQQTPDLVYSTLEEEPPGTFIANIAIDSKPLLPGQDFSQLRYQLFSDSNAYADLFNLFETSGRLEIKQKIDRETVCIESVTCDIEMKIGVLKDDPKFPNNPDLVKVLLVKITLLDYNDHPPVFPSPEVALTISESVTIGYVLSTNAATDQDYGANNSVQFYEFLTVQDVFRLKETPSGAPTIGIEVVKLLDYETKNFYQLTIIAKDGGFPQKTGTVIVNISVLDENDNNPEFTKSEYSVTIPENPLIGTTLLRVSATDNDGSKHGILSYQFSPRISPTLKTILSMNETSGEIVVIGEIDYETDKRFSLPVQAHDNGDQPKTAEAMVVIQVTDENDNAPEININLPPGGEEISEAAQPDRYIANVAVVDPDNGENGTISCEMDSEHFQLEMIYKDMYKITLKKKLDRETQPVHNVTVFCYDNGNPRKETRTKFSIKVGDVNDNPPVFTESTYTAGIYENNKIGETVVVVTAEDSDIGINGKVIFSLDSDAKDYFSINSSTGVITANKVLDREQQNQYSFHVIATNEVAPKHRVNATVIVTILDRNDEVPRFSENLYTFRVPENKAPGTIIGTVFAYDNDVGPNGKIEYIFNSKYNKTFTILQNTGQIRADKVLDRETRSLYSFQLVVRDKGDPVRESSTDVIVRVEDINDNVPDVAFPNNNNNTVSISPPKTKGEIITRVIASDRDQGTNSKLSYVILKGNEYDLFSINNETGIIILNKNIKQEDAASLTLLLEIQDGGVPAQKMWTNLVIVITDNEANKNLIIVIAVVSVTVTLSVAMIIMICIIRNQDSCKEKQKSKEFSEHKNNFINDWLRCLSSSTKEIHKHGMDKMEPVKVENQLSQPILPSSQDSNSSEDSKEKFTEDSNFVDTLDSGKGESIRDRHNSDSSQMTGQGPMYNGLSRYPTQNLHSSDTMSDQQFSIAPSDAVSIPESWTNRPAQLHPAYTTRTISFDDEMLREKPVNTFSSFREIPRPRTESQISTISNNSNSGYLGNSGVSCGYSLDSQTLQRHLRGKQSHQQRQGFLNASSAKMAQKRQLPPIMAAPEHYESSVHQSNSTFHPSSKPNSPSYKQNTSFDIPSSYGTNPGLKFREGRSLSQNDTQSQGSHGTTLKSFAINPLKLEKDIEDMLNQTTDCIV